MSRRNGSVLDALLVLPWWVAILVGIAGYAALTLLLPMFWKGQMPGAMAQSLRPVAFLWLGLCSVAAIASAIRAWFVRRKFDRQGGIEQFRSLSWRQFESIVGEAFRRRGYDVVETGGSGADDGVDLVLRRDGEKLFVQCKQWKSWKVGVKPVREFLGAIAAREADGGFFVTSGAYTREARDFAAHTSIELIDGPALEELVREAQTPEPFIDPTVRKRDPTISSRRQTPPACPVCGESMTRRTAQHGASAGEEFWGCVRFPKCRGTRAM